ncbi:MAG: hypothetical protein H8D23_01660 [Candidatus Brocadiales bacterium]|nr:hypothetical protein [Candidatus Brocadiales bacterium]
MIVDEEQYSHDFYHEMLENTEYEVISAYDSNEALSKLEINRPVLIVIDSPAFQDIDLTITGREDGDSGCKENIAVIKADDFFLQVVLVQTFLGNRASDIRKIKLACESRGS